MQISKINSIGFGLLDSALETKIKKAIFKQNYGKDISEIKRTKDYRNFCHIINHTKESCLFEYNICDRIGTIYDLNGVMKSIDISKAYKEKDETLRYLKIIKIIAKHLK